MQAQISAALTPAFAAEAPVILKSLACQISSVYVSSGINRDVSALSRVLKSLTLCLEAHKAESDHAVGSSPHGNIILKLSVLMAWAGIQNSAQPLSREILPPFDSTNFSVLSTLVPMWLSCLMDYAKIRHDLEASVSVSSHDGGSMDVYSSATRDLVLPYYVKYWIPILEAFTSLVLSNNEQVLSLLTCDGNPSNAFKSIFGLCIESISTQNWNALEGSSNQKNIAPLISILKSLRAITCKQLAGNVFEEKVRGCNYSSQSFLNFFQSWTA